MPTLSLKPPLQNAQTFKKSDLRSLDRSKLFKEVELQAEHFKTVCDLLGKAQVVMQQISTKLKNAPNTENLCECDKSLQLKFLKLSNDRQLFKVHLPIRRNPNKHTIGIQADQAKTNQRIVESSSNRPELMRKNEDQSVSSTDLSEFIEDKFRELPASRSMGPKTDKSAKKNLHSFDMENDAPSRRRKTATSISDVIQFNFNRPYERGYFQLDRLENDNNDFAFFDAATKNSKNENIASSKNINDDTVAIVTQADSRMDTKAEAGSLKEIKEAVDEIPEEKLEDANITQENHQIEVKQNEYDVAEPIKEPIKLEKREIVKTNDCLDVDVCMKIKSKKINVSTRNRLAIQIMPHIDIQRGLVVQKIPMIIINSTESLPQLKASETCNIKYEIVKHLSSESINEKERRNQVDNNSIETQDSSAQTEKLNAGNNLNKNLIISEEFSVLTENQLKNDDNMKEIISALLPIAGTIKKGMLTYPLFLDKREVSVSDNITEQQDESSSTICKDILSKIIRKSITEPVLQNYENNVTSNEYIPVETSTHTNFNIMSDTPVQTYMNRAFKYRTDSEQFTDLGRVSLEELKKVNSLTEPSNFSTTDSRRSVGVLLNSEDRSDVGHYIKDMIKDPSTERLLKSYQIIHDHVTHEPLNQVDLSPHLAYIDDEVYKTFVNPEGIKTTDNRSITSVKSTTSSREERVLRRSLDAVRKSSIKSAKETDSQTKNVNFKSHGAAHTQTNDPTLTTTWDIIDISNTLKSNEHELTENAQNMKTGEPELTKTDDISNLYFTLSNNELELPLTQNETNAPTNEQGSIPAQMPSLFYFSKSVQCKFSSELDTTECAPIIDDNSKMNKNYDPKINENNDYKNNDDPKINENNDDLTINQNNDPKVNKNTYDSKTTENKVVIIPENEIKIIKNSSQESLQTEKSQLIDEMFSVVEGEPFGGSILTNSTYFNPEAATPELTDFGSINTQTMFYAKPTRQKGYRSNSVVQSIDNNSAADPLRKQIAISQSSLYVGTRDGISDSQKKTKPLTALATHPPRLKASVGNITIPKKLSAALERRSSRFSLSNRPSRYGLNVPQTMYPRKGSEKMVSDSDAGPNKATSQISLKSTDTEDIIFEIDKDILRSQQIYNSKSDVHDGRRVPSNQGETKSTISAATSEDTSEYVITHDVSVQASLSSHLSDTFKNLTDETAGKVLTKKELEGDASYVPCCMNLCHKNKSKDSYVKAEIKQPSATLPLKSSLIRTQSMNDPNKEEERRKSVKIEEPGHIPPPPSLSLPQKIMRKLSAAPPRSPMSPITPIGSFITGLTNYQKKDMATRNVPPPNPLSIFEQYTPEEIVSTIRSASGAVFADRAQQTTEALCQASLSNKSEETNSIETTNSSGNSSSSEASSITVLPLSIKYPKNVLNVPFKPFKPANISSSNRNLPGGDDANHSINLKMSNNRSIYQSKYKKHEGIFPQSHKYKSFKRTAENSFPEATASESEKTEDALSDGEVKCRCTGSIGEIHICPYAKDFKLAQYLRRHPKNLIDNEFGDPNIKIQRQRKFNSNWIAYYVSRSPSPELDNSDSINTNTDSSGLIKKFKY